MHLITGCRLHTTKDAVALHDTELKLSWANVVEGAAVVGDALAEGIFFESAAESVVEDEVEPVVEDVAEGAVGR